MEGIILLLMFMVLFLSGLVSGLGRAVSSAVESTGADYVALSDSAEDLITVSNLDGQTYDAVIRSTTAEAAPLDVMRMYLEAGSSSEKIDVTYFGVDPGSFVAPEVYEGVTLAGSDASNPIVLDDDFAAQGISLGDTVRDSSTGVEFTVCGFTKDKMYGHVSVAYVTSDGFAQVLEGLGQDLSGSHHAVALRGSSEQVAGIDVEGVEVASMATVVEALPGYRAEQMTITMVEWMLVVITAVVIAIFYYVVTIQKEREYGVMKAIGIGMGRIAAHICLQVLVISVVGAVVANLLAFALSVALPATMPFYLQPFSAALVSASFVGMSLLGSLASVMRVSRIDPMHVIGGEE